jgi:RimJ/RimL family protein N-acetyltransferase
MGWHDEHMSLTDRWPLFDLRIITADVELRYPSDDDLLALADVAARGVHDPAEMPFHFAWTDGSPDEVAQRVLQYNWRTRSEWTLNKWDLVFAVCVGGRIVGTQGLHAEGFPIRRALRTGSWLGREFQGQGIGTAMRQAALWFTFTQLQADFAFTAAHDDNPASNAVTAKLGYESNGFSIDSPRGVPVATSSFVLRRQNWVRGGGLDGVTCEGFEAARVMFEESSSPSLAT